MGYSTQNLPLFETARQQQANLRGAIEQDQISVAKAMAWVTWVGGCRNNHLQTRECTSGLLQTPYGLL